LAPQTLIDDYQWRQIPNDAPDRRYGRLINFELRRIDCVSQEKQSIA
jgi:hypothetical protein